MEDSHQTGVDPLSALIDPLVGFGYVVLDITATNGQRIVAGIHVGIEDGRSQRPRFNLENPPRERTAKIFCAWWRGTKSYPITEHCEPLLAAGGLTLRELRTVNEYGELL